MSTNVPDSGAGRDPHNDSGMRSNSPAHEQSPATDSGYDYGPPGPDSGGHGNNGYGAVGAGSVGYGHPGYGPGNYGQPGPQQTGYGHPYGNYGQASQGGYYPYGTQMVGSQPGVSVGLVEAVKRFYAKYAQFSGRASRSEYWFVVLFMTLAVLALMIPLFTIGTDYYGEPNAFGTMISLFLLVFFLGSLVPSIAIAVRRLHDANLSGWFYLLSLIPYIGGLVLLVLTVLPPKPEGARFDR